MLLKLDKKLLNADDKPLKMPDGSDCFMNKVLANELWGAGNDHVVKFYDWGMSLWKKGQINIDRTDVDILKTMVENHPKWDRFTKGRFLDELQNLK